MWAKTDDEMYEAELSVLLDGGFDSRGDVIPNALNLLRTWAKHFTDAADRILTAKIDRDARNARRLAKQVSQSDRSRNRIGGAI